MAGDEWSEVYNGDQRVLVGREFLSHLVVPLNDAGISQLRFTVKSPPNTGILIDDLKFVEPVPQEVIRTDVIPMTLPALVGVEAATILKFNVQTSGTLNPLSLKRAIIEFHEPEQCQIESIRIYATGSKQTFHTQTPLGTIFEVDANNVHVAFEHLLADGDNFFWVTVKLEENADIDDRIGVALKSVSFNPNANVMVSGAPSVQRTGVAVRKAGDDGVHTYRIPGLVTTNNGTLIAVYDIRHDGSGDLPGNIDVGMSRSTDGGRNWQPMKTIMDMGTDPNWNHDGIGDPSILVDQGTGTIWVAATWSHGNRSWNGSGPGLTPEETGNLCWSKATTMV